MTALSGASASRQDESSQQESEDRYRMLSENAEGAVMLVSAEGQLTWVSPSIERLLGYHADEALALRGGDLVHPDDIAEAQSALRLAGDRPVSLRLRFRHRDGGYLWMAATSRWLMDAEGHRTGRIDSLRDIDAEVRAQLLLAEQSQRLMLVLAASRLGMWDWNLVTGETAFDERWAEIAGYRLDELEPTSIDTWQRLAHPGDLAASEAMIAEHLAGRAPFYDLELRVRHREGHWVWVHDRGQVVERSPDGRPTRMMGTHEDISARVTAVETLNANRYDLEQAQRIAHVGSWRLDLATDHVTWTDELFLMLGLDPAEAPPDYPEHQGLFTDDSWTRLSAALARTRATGQPYDLELEFARLPDQQAWMHARGEAVRDAAGDIVALRGVAMDITQRKRDRDALTALATHDQLTGLVNRAALLEEIARALSAGRRAGRETAVLMLDLDRFKDVNDSLGHRGGDDLLVEAAGRIRAAIRAEDVAARPGGDEFVIVMRDLTETAEARHVAERLIEAFRAPFVVGGVAVRATASIGIAFATSSSTADSIVREADGAMYEAKEGGRDRLSLFCQSEPSRARRG